MHQHTNIIRNSEAVGITAMDRVLVRNLAFQVTQSQISQWLYQNVPAANVGDVRVLRHGRGCEGQHFCSAFITLGSADEVAQAVAAMDGQITDLSSKRLSAVAAVPRMNVMAQQQGSVS